MDSIGNRSVSPSRKKTEVSRKRINRLARRFILTFFQLPSRSPDRSAGRAHPAQGLERKVLPQAITDRHSDVMRVRIRASCVAHCSAFTFDEVSKKTQRHCLGAQIIEAVQELFVRSLASRYARQSRLHRHNPHGHPLSRSDQAGAMDPVCRGCGGAPREAIASELPSASPEWF